MASPGPISILSVEDHPVFREGLSRILASQPDMVLVAQAGNAEQALAEFRRHRPDITLMDLRLPGTNGTDALIAIRGEFPHARIIMLTTSDSDGEIQRALRAGAAAYLLKDMPKQDILDAIRSVHAGRRHVPPEVSFLRSGVYRFADGTWTRDGGYRELPQANVLAEFTDSIGRVWLGYVKNQLALLNGHQVQLFGSRDGLRLGNITAIYGQRTRIWIGGEFGLVGFENGHFQTIAAVNEEWLRGISGIVETSDGDLWLNGLAGIFHISRLEISEALRNTSYRLKGEHFGRRHGLPGVPTQLHPLPTVIEGTDGRLWFALQNGVVWLDPATYSRHGLTPPAITIESVSADEADYAPAPSLSLPARTSSVQINYTAVSLSDPDAIRFRYQLQGTDRGWHETTTSNPAVYRNLAPGTYRFMVTASDTDGVWSDNFASAVFTILPAWYQTNWFLMLCVISSVVAVWVLYQVRVRQVARSLSARFDERLAERTRVAREIHDTLLQTVQGSKMVADDALDRPDDAAGMQRAMRELSGWLGQAAQEGRETVKALRTSTTQQNDLAQAFRRAIEDCQRLGSMQSSLSVIGDARDMHPVVRDEVYRIGYEAIRNACAHSRGSRLEVTLQYAHDLTVRVADNGVGIDPAIVDEGKEGHFGLQGLRERAARIGAKLALVSSDDSGTDIVLTVPGRAVFRKTATTLFERIRAIVTGKGPGSELH